MNWKLRFWIKSGYHVVPSPSTTFVKTLLESVFLFTDRTKSLKQNIMMTAPIMSRFDLFFILVDDCNEVTDYAIARRIIDLHTRAEQSVDRTYEPDDISRYIR